MQGDSIHTIQNLTPNEIEFMKDSLIYKTIQRIIQYHHSGKLVEKLKSEIRFREVKITEYQDSNEIELIKQFPHINKQELREFNFFNSLNSSCPPRFSSMYSPIKYILDYKFFEGVSLNLRYVHGDKLIIKHNFSAEENRVNDFHTSLFSLLTYDDKRIGKLHLLNFYAEFLRYTYNFKLIFPIFQGKLFVYNARFNIVNERKDEIEIYSQFRNFFSELYYSRKLKTFSLSVNLAKRINLGLQLRQSSNDRSLYYNIAGQVILRKWLQILFCYKQNNQKLFRLGVIYHHNKELNSAIQCLFQNEYLPVITYGFKLKFLENSLFTSLNSDGLISSRYSIIFDDSLKMNMCMSINPFEKLDLKQRNFGLSIEFFP